MPTKDEYDAAASRVRNGTANARDRELNDRMARNAGGGQPSQARDAQRVDGRRNRR